MPAEEEVDVVDAQDRVVGRATRGEMRRRNLRHRVVYVLVFNAAGQLFVHRRSAAKDIYPSHWDVAIGGVVEAGETYEAGAQREIAEELGVHVGPVRAIMPVQFEDEATRVNGRVFTLAHEGPFRLQREEIESGEWLDLDRVLERAQREPFCPDGIEALLRYLDRLSNVQRSP